MVRPISSSGQKPIRKIRKRGTNPMRLYFNAGTQKAIVEYQTCLDKREREKLYNEIILPAFEKLVENLINIHKFTGLHESYTELKNDCITFLFETIVKFKADRGTNAFSYFNVVAKNWLIIRTKQKGVRLKKHVSVDDTENLTIEDQEIIEKLDLLPSQEDTYVAYESRNHTSDVLEKIKGMVQTEAEKNVIESISRIFASIDDIDLLNKSAVLLYVRELSGTNSKQLTSTLQVIRQYYRRAKIEIAEEADEDWLDDDDDSDDTPID